MIYTNKRTLHIYLGCAAILLGLGFIRAFRLTHFYAPYMLGGIDGIGYTALAVVWAISLQRRILHRELRSFLVAQAVMMAFWMWFRLVRYFLFWESDMISRAIWYAYYIPMMLIPLFSFLAALNIGKQGGKEISVKWKWLYLPAVFLCMGILTNDLHQTAFSFFSGFAHWEDQYSYEILYYIAVVWMAVFLVATLVIVFMKCRILCNRKRIWIPFCSLTLGVLYFLFYALRIPFYPFLSMYRMPEVFCMMIVGMWEGCIVTGLIATNMNYEDFFEVSSLGAMIMDGEGTIQYASENAKTYTKEQLEEAKKENTAVDEDHILCSNKIKGGAVFWENDISKINRINRELEAIGKELEAEHELLDAENRLEEQRAKIEEKNRLYDEIARLSEPQITKILSLLNRPFATEEEFEKNLKIACVLEVYVKRRGNLTLLARQKENLDYEDLYLSMQETLEYLKLCGIKKQLPVKKQGVCPSEKILKLYDEFQKEVEKELFGGGVPI